MIAYRGEESCYFARSGRAEQRMHPMNVWTPQAGIEVGGGKDERNGGMRSRKGISRPQRYDGPAERGKDPKKDE